MRPCGGPELKDAISNAYDLVKNGMLNDSGAPRKPLDDALDLQRVDAPKAATSAFTVANAVAARVGLPTALTWNRAFSPSIAPFPSAKLTRANKSDGCKYQTMTRDLASGQATTKNLTLVSGIGLHESCQFSLRTPVLLLPGLKILKKILQMGFEPPRYVIYQATDFIAACNGISPARARASANRLQSYLERYIQAYHAEAAPYVQFRLGMPHTQECRDAIEKIRTRVNAVALENPSIATVVSSLRESGLRHARRRDAGEEYLAANLFYSGALRQEWPFFTCKGASQQWILVIGGENERRFFRILGAMNDARVIPMVTGMGTKSAYYPFTEEGDMSDLMDCDTEATMSKSITNDYECLRYNGTDRLQLVRLLGPIRTEAD